MPFKKIWEMRNTECELNYYEQFSVPNQEICIESEDVGTVKFQPGPVCFKNPFYYPFHFVTHCTKWPILVITVTSKHMTKGKMNKK